MSLRTRAVLEIDLEDDSGATRTGVFELKEDLETTTEITRKYLLSNRGQYLREAYDIGSDFQDALPGGDLTNRRGYHVDGGAGAFVVNLSATGGDRDLSWGDGSTDPDDQSDVSRYDATGADPLAQQQILEWYVSQAKTGSLGQARLYWGEWSDGTHASSTGAFGKPLVVALNELTTSDPPDDASAFSVDITAAWTALFPDAAVAEAQKLIDEIAAKVPE